MTSGFGVADERGLRVAGYLTRGTEEIIDEGISVTFAVGGRVSRVHEGRKRGGGRVEAFSRLRRGRNCCRHRKSETGKDREKKRGKGKKNKGRERRGKGSVEVSAMPIVGG
jgi:hypothetical protein